MSPSNKAAGKSRQANDDNRRVTRSASRSQPPLTIPEEPRRSSRVSRPVLDKKKGKAPIVEPENKEGEDMKTAIAESRKSEHRRRKKSGQDIGGSSKRRDEPLLDASSKEEDWPSRETLEAYLTTHLKKLRYAELLDYGYSSADALIAVEKRRRESLERKIKEYYAVDGSEEALRAMGLEGTCYADLDTMHRLGIARDFERLAIICGLNNFPAAPHDTYYEETIQFLNTINVHRYDKLITPLLEREGGGYITFTVNEVEYKVTLKHIQELFKFEAGAVASMFVNRGEVDAVWRLLTGKPLYVSTNSKGNWIRNPAISYFRRAVAHTLFARDTTGNVNKSEAEILSLAMKDILGSVYGRELVGDTENSGMAAILVAHMCEYRNRAVQQLKTKKHKRRNSIGGAACAIMEYAGVRFSEYQADGEEPNNIGFRFMDERYLVAQRMVCRQDTSLYRFIHPEVGEAYIRLPRTDWVSIRNNDYLRNAEFIPPVDELEDPNRGPPSPPPPPPQPFDYNPEQEAPNVQQGQGEPSTKVVKMVQKMKKSFMKQIGKLVLKDKEKRKKITALERRVDELESRQSMEDERKRHSDADFAIVGVERVPYEGREDRERPARHSDVGFMAMRYSSSPRHSGNEMLSPLRRRNTGDDEEILAEQGALDWTSDQEEETPEALAGGPREPFDPYGTYGDDELVYRSPPPRELTPEPPVQYPVFPPLYKGPPEDAPPEWTLTSASRRLVLEAPMPLEPPPWLQEPQIQLRGENTYLPGSPGWLPPSVPARLWWEEVSDPRWTHRPVQNWIQHAAATSSQRIPRPPQNEEENQEAPPFWNAPPEWTRNINQK